MKQKKLKIAALVLILLLSISCGAVGIYASDYYRMDQTASCAMAGSDRVAVSLHNDIAVFAPEQAEAGLIFYPGGKVEYTAYAPLMRALAEEGVLCVIPRMPLNLAVLDMDAAEGIPELFPEIERWYLGGHSLGGSMAASYLAEAHGFAGLLLLASYSTVDLSDSTLSVLSIYGSNDGVLNMEKYNECFSNLPDETIEVVLDGGNHAQFGSYGFQDGDAKAELDPQMQLAQTVDTILPWMGIAVDPIEKQLESMTTEEKVGQLFLAGCSPNKAIEHLSRYQLGGFILFSDNFLGETPDSVRATIERYQNSIPIPMLIAVDEEGGIVTRISHHKAFRHTKFPSARSCFAKGGMDAVLQNEAEKCELLRSLGINVNLGPVCDITTARNAFMYTRSLGQDAQTTADYITETVALMSEYHIGSALKHFPGYGNNADTHIGIATDSRSMAELESNDLIPFRAGIDAGCNALMVSHTVVQALDSTLPASLSPTVISYIREHMGFDGVIITDDLAMHAVAARYGTEEAAVLAVLAGCDVLCSTDFEGQYTAVLNAVNSGRISTETLDSAVYNILEWKLDLGLLNLDES